MLNSSLSVFSDYKSIAEDGYYGPKTEAAIQRAWNDLYPFEISKEKKVVTPQFWRMLVQNSGAYLMNFEEIVNSIK